MHVSNVMLSGCALVEVSWKSSKLLLVPFGLN